MVVTYKWSQVTPSSPKHCGYRSQKHTMWREGVCFLSDQPSLQSYLIFGNWIGPKWCSSCIELAVYELLDQCLTNIKYSVWSWKLSIVVSMKKSLHYTFLCANVSFWQGSNIYQSSMSQKTYANIKSSANNFQKNILNICSNAGVLFRPKLFLHLVSALKYVGWQWTLCFLHLIFVSINSSE